MSQMSPATALRQLQQAQAALKKARQAVRVAKGDPSASRGALRVGWESLVKAHRLLAEIPYDAATEPVMTKQLAVERYSTALLVRLRRLLRAGDVEEADDELDLEGDLDDDSEI
jgi:hypothetical protein